MTVEICLCACDEPVIIKIENARTVVDDANGITVTSWLRKEIYDHDDVDWWRVSL